MIIKEILNRRSVRDFKPDIVGDESIMEIIKAAQFAPTARDNRAVEFIVIREQATKDQLDVILESQQEYVKIAPVIIIPVIDTEKSVLSTQDLSIASENIFLQATAEGLGTVWKNVNPAQAGEIKKLMKIPDNFTLINIIPVGYSDEKLDPHSDEEFKTEKIHNEKW